MDEADETNLVIPMPLRVLYCTPSTKLYSLHCHKHGTAP